MNENQKAFLNELDALLTKYSITGVNSGAAIRFLSNNSELTFKEYASGKFTDIQTKAPEYDPPEPQGNG